MGFPKQTDGYFGVPPGPGLGVDLDEGWLAVHPWDKSSAPWRPATGSNPSRQDTNWS